MRHKDRLYILKYYALIRSLFFQIKRCCTFGKVEEWRNDSVSKVLTLGGIEMGQSRWINPRSSILNSDQVWSVTPFTPEIQFSSDRSFKLNLISLVIPLHLCTMLQHQMNGFRSPMNTFSPACCRNTQILTNCYTPPRFKSICFNPFCILTF